MNQHKPWFDEECLGFLDQRKEDKTQWLQDPSQSGVDNLNNVRHEASRHFTNKKKEYLKAKIEELETNSEIKNTRDLHRDINDFMKGYRPRANIEKDEKADLVTGFHGTLDRCRNHFCRQLSGHGANDVRQTEILTAKPLLPEPSAFEFGMLIEKLKRHKSPGIDKSSRSCLSTRKNISF